MFTMEVVRNAIYLTVFWNYEMENNFGPSSTFGIGRLEALHSILFAPSNMSTAAASSSMLSAAETPMPPPNSDLATTWTFLEEGVDHIMTKLHTGVSYSKYMSLYTVSYNYCTSSRMHGNAEPAGLGGRSLLSTSLRHCI